MSLDAEVLQAIRDATAAAVTAAVADLVHPATTTDAAGQVVTPTPVEVATPVSPIDELFSILNLAKVPNAVTNVEEWLARHFGAAASVPPAASSPAGGTTVAPVPVVSTPEVSTPVATPGA